MVPLRFIVFIFKDGMTEKHVSTKIWSNVIKSLFDFVSYKSLRGKRKATAFETFMPPLISGHVPGLTHTRLIQEITKDKVSCSLWMKNLNCSWNWTSSLQVKKSIKTSLSVQNLTYSSLQLCLNLCQYGAPSWFFSLYSVKRSLCWEHPHVDGELGELCIKFHDNRQGALQLAWPDTSDPHTVVILPGLGAGTGIYV